MRGNKVRISSEQVEIVLRTQEATQSAAASISTLPSRSAVEQCATPHRHQAAPAPPSPYGQQAMPYARQQTAPSYAAHSHTAPVSSVHTTEAVPPYGHQAASAHQSLKPPSPYSRYAAPTAPTSTRAPQQPVRAAAAAPAASSGPLYCWSPAGKTYHLVGGQCWARNGKKNGWPTGTLSQGRGSITVPNERLSPVNTSVSSQKKRRFLFHSRQHKGI